jgi:hypothetical protein
MPRQHTAERREQRPISRREPRPSDLTLQHAKLVVQQQDLDLLLPLGYEITWFPDMKIPANLTVFHRASVDEDVASPRGAMSD